MLRKALLGSKVGQALRVTPVLLKALLGRKELRAVKVELELVPRATQERRVLKAAQADRADKERREQAIREHLLNR